MWRSNKMHPLLSFYLRTAFIAIGGAFAIVGIPTIIFVFLAAGFGAAMCDNTIIYEIPSPSNQLKATVFDRSCGATTGFSIQVSILKKDEPLPEGGGNIFVADTGRGNSPRSQGGGPDVKIDWVSDKHLRITHHPMIQVHVAQNLLDQVKIEYSMRQSLK